MSNNKKKFETVKIVNRLGLDLEELMAWHGDNVTIIRDSAPFITIKSARGTDEVVIRPSTGNVQAKNQDDKTFIAKLVTIDDVPAPIEGTMIRIPATVFITKAKGDRETFIVINDNYHAGVFAGGST